MKTSDALQMASFASPHEQLVLTVLHTASGLLGKHRMLLKPHGITPEQFNILRILRGQKGKPIALRDISNRMIDQNSNTSRLSSTNCSPKVWCNEKRAPPIDDVWTSF